MDHLPGFKNQDSTCYMNAAIQTLCNLPSIEAVLTPTISSTYYTNAHQNWPFLYLEGEMVGKPSMIKISRDALLVKNLGIKWLIGVDILGLEGAIFDLPAERLHHANGIPCPLTTKPLEPRQELPVHSLEQILAKPNSVINVPV